MHIYKRRTSLCIIIRVVQRRVYQEYRVPGQGSHQGPTLRVTSITLEKPYTLKDNQQSRTGIKQEFVHYLHKYCTTLLLLSELLKNTCPDNLGTSYLPIKICE
jgi:hypothetical protein